MLAGLALARLAIPFIAATGLPRAEEVRVDGIVIAFTILAVAIVTAVIAAIISAYGARPVSLMANDRGSTGTPRAARMRALLVGTQVAIAVMLLAGGALLVESYRRLRGVEAGFNPSNVLTFRIALPNAKYPEARQRRAFFDELQQNLAATPGVVAMSAISELPLSSDDWTATFNIDGYARSQGQPSGHIRIIMPGYASVMRIPLLRGRMFDARDTADAPKVVVIDEMMARRYWPNQDPLGKRMTFSDDLSKATWREVVGVIGAVHHASLDVPAEPHLYLPTGQASSFTQLYGVLRTRGDAERVAADLRGVVRSLDPSQPVFAIRTMEQYLDDATSQPRLRATILALFAGIGVLLALLGLYALLSYISIARTREIGLRMALGATQPEIVRFITVWAVRITGFGVIAGLAGAVAMMRSMRAMLFGVEQLQFPALAAVAAGFLFVALLASAAPALRAARVDPAVALRHD
jgi:predicted permease